MQLATTAETDLTENILNLMLRTKELFEHAEPDFVNDQRIGVYLDDLTEALDALDRGASVKLGPDRSHPENIRCQFRQALAVALRDASWLAESTRSRIAALAERCPAYLSKGKYRFTYDCFSSRAHQWEEDLRRFDGRPGLRFLEIGSFEGHSACWLLDNILTDPSCELTCIDLFEPQTREIFEHNLANAGGTRKVRLIEGRSQEVLRTLHGAEYDFIYIDGSHEQVDLLEDAVLAWPLLRKGGLLTFDDYGLRGCGMAPFYLVHPERAIDAFLLVYQGRYRKIRVSYQVTIEKL